MLTSAIDRLAFADRSASDMLTYGRLAAPNIGMLDDGTHFAMFHMPGKPLFMKDDPGRYAERRAYQSVLRGLAGPDVAIYQHLVCHEQTSPFSLGAYRSAYAADLAADYHAATDAGLVTRDWFFTIMITPDVATRALALFRPNKRRTEADQRTVRALEERCALVADAMSAYQPRRLGVRTHQGVAFSEIAEAIRLILYCRWEAVPVPAGRLADAIYSDRVICGLGAFEIRGTGRQHFGINFGLREYVEKATPRLMDEVVKAPGYYVITNSFRFLSRGKITDSLGLRENQMASTGDRATSLIDGLGDAMDDVSVGRTIMGDHHFSVAVHVDHHQDLDAAASRMRSLLINSGLPVSQEAVGCEASYWAQAPGSPAWLRARHGAISAHNFASFSPLAGEPRGGGRSIWGAPVLRLRTTAGTAHDFHAHVVDVGHTLIFGPSGSGKTTFLALVAAMLEPLTSPQRGVVVVLDADGSNEITVRACGGYYLQIKRGQPSGMAPWKALKNTPDARAWLLEFTLGLIVSDNGPSPSQSQIDRLAKGIQFLMRQRAELRSFAALRQFADHVEGGCGERLHRWTRHGSLGWAFDGDEDLIRLDAGIVGIDNSEILVDDAAMVRAPSAAYQLYRIGEAVGTGVPGVVFADEAHAYLPDARFAAGFERFVTRLRKGNGMLWLATQQPQVILRHAIGKALVSNSFTKILFADASADISAYRDGLHCTEGEIQAIREGMTALGRGTFLVKRDTGSFIGRADLSGLQDHVAILSANPRRRALMHRIIAEVGSNPDAWVPEYRRRHKEAD